MVDTTGLRGVAFADPDRPDGGDSRFAHHRRRRARSQVAEYWVVHYTRGGQSARGARAPRRAPGGLPPARRAAARARGESWPPAGGPRPLRERRAPLAPAREGLHPGGKRGTLRGNPRAPPSRRAGCADACGKALAPAGRRIAERAAPGTLVTSNPAPRALVAAGNPPVQRDRPRPPDRPVPVVGPV